MKSLLNTYYEERAPVAEINIKWSIENATRYAEINEAIHLGDTEKLITKLHEQSQNLNYTGLDLGFVYRSRAVISESNQSVSITPSEYIPTTLPGSRAPHVKLIKNGEITSTLDLFEKEFVLLIGSEGECWRIAAKKLADKCLIPLITYKIAAEGDLIDPDDMWHEIYEISKSGAVLVRPDGHVTWRSKSATHNPGAQLQKCFAAMLV